MTAPLVLVAACHSDPPNDCSLDPKRRLEKQLQCMEKFGPGDDRKMLLACVPFSKPETIGGSWVFGFEANSFYEGEQASPEVLKRDTAPPSDRRVSAASDTTLVFNPDVPRDGKLRVFQIRFVGRRAACPIGPEREIVVDRVLSSTLRGVIG